MTIIMPNKMVTINRAVWFLLTIELCLASTSSNLPQKTVSDIDTFLRRMYATRPDNCSVETMGPGVVQTLARDRFKRQAMIAVTRANLLTYLWKYNPDYLYRESVLFWLVSSLVESDEDIFAAGNCYDFNQFKSFGTFCPYAFRNKKDGTIIVKDLAKTHHYENELTEEHEWFHEIRRIGLRIINNTKSYRKESIVNFFLPNDETNKTYNTLAVNYDDGHWSLPYYDCGGGNIWMITYTVPFFGYDRLARSYTFKGTSGIDIDLMQVDINQCSSSDKAITEVNVFANTHKCKESTFCAPISGQGFQRGSYKCFCKPGFYFPPTRRYQFDEMYKGYYFNGSDIEEQFDKKQDGEDSDYDTAYDCIACAPGCDTCEDGRPCLFPINWILRILLLGVTILVMLSVVGWSILVRMYQDFKAIKAASPLLLQIILGGALLSYTPMIVHFFEPNELFCTLQFWPREIGFAIIYASILFKTWRIAVVFRPTKNRNVKITDMMLLRRIAMAVGAFGFFCAVRTIFGRPQVVMIRHSSGMKTFTCNFDEWDYSINICKLLFLIWGIWLSILVHKTPSEFNESRFISWAIYNETIMSIFFNISMFFLNSSGNPDLFYILVFLHLQLTVTGTTAFLFASKAYHLIRSIRAGETRDSKTRRFVPALASKSSMAGGLGQSSGRKSLVPVQESDGSADSPSFDGEGGAQSVALSSSHCNQRSPTDAGQLMFNAKKPSNLRAKQKETSIEEENRLMPKLSLLQEQIDSLREEVARTKAASQLNSSIIVVSTELVKDVSPAPLTPSGNGDDLTVSVSPKITDLQLSELVNGLNTPSKSRSESSCASGSNTLHSNPSTHNTDEGVSSLEKKDSLADPTVDGHSPLPFGDFPPQMITQSQTMDIGCLPNGKLKSHHQNNKTEFARVPNMSYHEAMNGGDCVAMDSSIVSPDDPEAANSFIRRLSNGTSRLWHKRNGKSPSSQTFSQPQKSLSKSQVVVEADSKNVVNCVQFTYV